MCILAPDKKKCEYEDGDTIICSSSFLAKSCNEFMQSLPAIGKYFEDYVCPAFVEKTPEKTEEDILYDALKEALHNYASTEDLKEYYKFGDGKLRYMAGYLIHNGWQLKEYGNNG